MDNFQLTKERDEELKVGQHTWTGKEDKTGEKLLHDNGTGEKVLLRLFEFKLNPTLTVLPTKEQILTPEYLKQLRVQLWADGLRLVMEPEVRIDKESCKIFAPCVPSIGNNFIEESKTIQEWTT